MKDIRLEMRLRNNMLWTAIHSRYKNIRQFCKAPENASYKFRESDVGDLLNLKRSPIGKTGVLRKVAASLSEVTGLLCEDLFPDRIYHLGVPTQKVVEVDTDTAFRLMPERQMALLEAPAEDAPEAIANKHEQREAIERVLSTLTFRESMIIKLRYGLDGYTYTLEEVGRIFKITRERVRAIEARAIRKLQHPKRAGPLECFAPPYMAPHTVAGHGMAQENKLWAPLARDEGPDALLRPVPEGH